MTESTKGLQPASAPYFNLGKFGRTIRTTSPDAQTWFDRGLIWIYSFHHEEAVICLENALAHDPSCVMAHWALAYALGPNYNFRWEFFSPDHLQLNMTRIHKVLDDVKPLLDTADPLERSLMEALIPRFPREYGGRAFREWNDGFVERMEKVYQQYGENDLDVVTVFADSMMCLAPWRLWDLRTGEPSPGIPSRKIQQVIEKALLHPDADRHPGLLHLYIHLTEMTTQPERAIPAADKLLGLIPDAGHLNHMPSHLDILIGDYRRAIYSNALAIVSDEHYISKRGPGGFYTIYRLHDFQSLIYAAMFNGQYKVALNCVEAMEKYLPEEVIRALPDWVESAFSTRLHVLARFGRWEEILAMDLPKDEELYCTTTVTQRYARGVAYAATGRVDLALKELEAFRETFKIVPESRQHFPNRSVDVLPIGEAMLAGEIEYRRQNYDVAFEHLRTSIKRYDSIVYGEPWGWMQPIRHAYAALQLQQGNLKEALATYEADLGYDDELPRAHQHPNNVWSLHGYHECLEKMGRIPEAKIILPQLRLALAVADVKISSSCFCRLETDEGLLVNGPGPKCCD
jgi:tetratricopeptide (TPR) repeat protein